jgi:hypothetical protein
VAPFEKKRHVEKIQTFPCPEIIIELMFWFVKRGGMVLHPDKYLSILGGRRQIRPQ